MCPPSTHRPKRKKLRPSSKKPSFRLPKEQREVITLHLWGGLTFKDIAALTGDSINTVAGRYRYALNNLHKKLSPLRDELVTHEDSPGFNILPFAPQEALS
ncbi:MAG: hypothetical protein IPK32_13915 [Verrucomicrobiaceae bacterium]|nr:hypothetical protein [Verrucomicrobiaceae bacterium]